MLADSKGADDMKRPECPKIIAPCIVPKCICDFKLICALKSNGVNIKTQHAQRGSECDGMYYIQMEIYITVYLICRSVGPW